MKPTLLFTVLAVALTSQAQAQNRSKAEILHYPEVKKFEASLSWNGGMSSFAAAAGPEDSGREDEIYDLTNTLSAKISYGITPQWSISLGSDYLLKGETTYPNDIVNGWKGGSNSTSFDVTSEGLKDVTGSVEYRHALGRGQIHVGAEGFHSLGEHEVELKITNSITSNPEKEQPLSRNALSGGSRILPYVAIQGPVRNYTLGILARGTLWGSERTVSYQPSTPEKDQGSNAPEPVTPPAVEQKQEGGGILAASVFAESTMGPFTLGLAGTLKTVGEVVIPASKKDGAATKEHLLTSAHKLAIISVMPKWAFNDRLTFLGSFEYKRLLDSDNFVFHGQVDENNYKINDGSAMSLSAKARFTF